MGNSRRRHHADLALVEELPPPSAPPPSGHLVQFYEDDNFLVEAIARFLGTGEPAVVIATAAHRRSLQHELQARSSDLAGALARGELLFFDARDTLDSLMVDGRPSWNRLRSVLGAPIEALAAGRAPVRVYGEMVDLLWRDGCRVEALELERMWNRLAEEHRFVLMCAYVLGNFRDDEDAALFSEICQAHSHVIPTESYTRLADRDRRLREIGSLQQRARVLETELRRRRQLEIELRAALAERRKVERELRRLENERERVLDRERAARAEAEAANRAKDDFLAMLGHELRNPLAPIVTAVELSRLRGGSGPELDVIGRQVGHLVRLVDDLLDISRITGGKIELRRQRIEIADAVCQAVETVSPLLEERRHFLSIEVPSVGCPVLADPARLAQIVANLLSNAAKYSDAHSRIVISAESDAEVVRLRVRDHGIGIPAEVLSKVFDRFVQQPQARDRSQGGLGLGLAIVKSLIELHGGSVSARSEGPGQGSEFEITLPAAHDVGETIPQPPRAESEPGAAALRILVVDDNNDAALTLADALRLLGHEVRVAHDGPTAMAIAAELRPEVGLLDIGLPVMDGYELAGRLLAEPWAEDLALVAVTGYGQAADRKRSEEIGFLDHLVKPISLSAVKQIVERVGTGRTPDPLHG